MSIETNPASVRRSWYGPHDETEGGGAGGLDMFGSLNEETADDRLSPKNEFDFITGLDSDSVDTLNTEDQILGSIRRRKIPFTTQQSPLREASCEVDDKE